MVDISAASPGSVGGSGSISGGASKGSTDDRLAFNARSASGDGGGGGAVSSNWLMAGETARAGMIDSVTAENSGLPGPLVVDDGVFQARLLSPSKILSGAHARDLAGHLPGMVASSDWVCLFSDARHGASLKTLLARCEGWEPTLVVIEASVASAEGGGGGGDGSGGGSSGNGRSSGEPEGAVGSCLAGEDGAATTSTTAASTTDATAAGVDAAVKESVPAGGVSGKVKRRERVVFGGFASGAQWKNVGRGFHGNGQSFLFSFNGGRGGLGGGGNVDDEGRAELRRGGGGDGSGRGRALSIYPWAGSDRSFMTSDNAVGLGMGGGGEAGNFGFFVEPDLRRGSSGWCETFRNQPLAAPAPSVTAASLMAGAAGAGPGSGDVGGLGVGGDNSTGQAGGVFEVMSMEVWGFRVPKTPEGLSRIAL